MAGFQIFDADGRPVGRPEGYAKHSTAFALTQRRGRIRREIWSAFEARKAKFPDEFCRIIFRVEWVGDSP